MIMRKLFYIVILYCLGVVIVSCSADSFNFDSSTETGVSGSLSRFTIANNHLYTVDLNALKVFNVSDEKKPVFVKSINPGFGIETIFSTNELLFLGSRWGVYIYDISDAANPKHLSTYSHVFSCDPVVVSGNYAYSTLNSGGPCGRGVNRLDVIDVSDPSNPFEVKAINMQDPKGLGVSNNLLFVCDMGIKVFDISNPKSPNLLKKVSIPAMDVIPLGDLLLVLAEDGLYQYKIGADANLTLLSKLY